MKSFALGRLWRIFSIAYRHGLHEIFASSKDVSTIAAALSYLPVPASVREKPRALRIREALEELGPIFVKFGQILSTRPDLLPDDVAVELTRLQDRVTPFPGETARATVEAALEAPVDVHFEHFEVTPIASASVAQVHGARLTDGSEVVVKVLRPGIGDVIDRDIALLYTLARLVQRHWSEGKRLRPVDVVEDYDRTIHDELDLMREAANASQMRVNFEGSDLIYVPKVYFDLTTRDVMVMERIDGIPIRDVEAMKAAGIDMAKLARDGVEIFFTQAFRDGYFHADMHPGNIFVATNGQYRAVDFGIMGTLADADKRYLAENFLAFFNRDYRAVADAHIRAGWVPADTRAEDFEAAIRTVCEPIFAKPISEISFGKFVVRLFQTARRFKMPVQPQLVLLQKTLLNIEGLGRRLYPDLDLWDTAKPYLERWMSEQVGPRAWVNMLAHEAPRWARTMPQVPLLAHEVLTKLAQQPASTPNPGAGRSKRAVVEATAGASLVVAAAILQLADRTHSAWLFWPLLAVGVILLFRAVRAAAQEM